jgi:hypothetical protein
MKQLTVLAALALTAVLPMASALATPSDAADFAADCNDDGRLDVTGTDRYVGGAGALSGDCMIVLETGATLVLRKVELTGSGNLVAISSPAETTIRVVDSTIDVAGFLELAAGCCAGDTGVPEQDGTVAVKRSTLRAAGILLSASFDWPDGRVLVRSSDLEARRSGITVGASDVAGSDGTVRVVASTLRAVEPVVISTGSLGRTIVKANSFFAPTVTVESGAGGRCRSVGNTPAVACS